MLNITESPYNLSSWNSNATLREEADGWSNHTESAIADDRDNVFSMISALSYAIVAIGIPGNLLVIVSIILSKHLWTAPNILVLSLSLCDFLFLSIVVPVHAQTIRTGRWDISSELCWTIAFVSNCLVASSMLNTGAIAFNRYVAIILSHKYRHVRRIRTTVCTLVFVYLFPFILVVPIASGHSGTFGFDPNDRQCGRLDGETLQIITVFVLVVLPLVLMTICYIHILFHVLASRKRVAALGNRSTTVQNRTTEARLSVMLATVYVVYLITTLPVLVANFLQQCGVVLSRYSIVVTFCLVWMSSAINPIVYGLVNKKYRQAYRKALKKLLFSKEPTSDIVVVNLETR